MFEAGAIGLGAGVAAGPAGQAEQHALFLQARPINVELRIECVEEQAHAVDVHEHGILPSLSE